MSISKFELVCLSIIVAVIAVYLAGCATVKSDECKDNHRPVAKIIVTPHTGNLIMAASIVS